MMSSKSAAVVVSAIAFASAGALALEFAPEVRAAPACTITGDDGPNEIDGTPLSDVICALGGNDIIRGLGGNDRIVGGRGADRVYGGDGDDRLFGDRGNDRLWGGKGNDKIHGGDGRDLVSGQAAGDRLYGGRGLDRLYGGPVRDLLYARDGKRDRVVGGTGKDCARVDGLDVLVSIYERF
jgi:Ca2+-binding RTX toxin-like protein